MDSCFGYLTEKRIERLSDNSCKRISIDVSFSSLHKVMLVKGLNLNNCFLDMTLAVCVNTELHSKGQIISECPYGIIVWTKIPTKKISEISALASKERSNQKLY